jgi:hypothetical protein
MSSFGGNVDQTFHALGGKSRYQLLQLVVINMGVWGAAFQLLDNLFIGKILDNLFIDKVTGSTTSSLVRYWTISSLIRLLARQPLHW